MLVKVDVASLYKGLLPWQIKRGIILFIQKLIENQTFTHDFNSLPLFATLTLLIPE